MKKLLIVFLFLISILTFIFADTLFEYSVGYGVFKVKDTYNKKGETQTNSVDIKGNGITANGNLSFLGSQSSFGVDIGFFFLYPIKESYNNEELNVGIRDAFRGFRIGAIHRYSINQKLTLFSSFGYQGLLILDDYVDNNGFLTFVELQHGIYAQDRIAYSINNNLSVCAGVLVIVPLLGAATYNYKDNDAEIYQDKYSGYHISPYIGLGLAY